MALLNNSEHMIEINEFETVYVKGNIDNYKFDLVIYSEAFNLWALQDLSLLENMRPVKYQELVERIEQFLIRKAA